MPGFLRALRPIVPVFMALMAGCAIAPGQYVKPDGWFSSAGEPDVEVIPITPRLIATQMPVVESEEGLPSSLLSYQPGPYKIGPGDSLYVTVWDHPELTVPTGTQINNSDVNGRVVGADGAIFYPYIGLVEVAGKTVDQLRVEIAKRLAKYIESPQVDVSVIRFASQKIFYSGAFQALAPQALTNVPMSLAEAIGRNGINAELANLAGFELIRSGTRYRLNLDRLALDGRALASVHLMPGDTLYLPYNDRRKVYVMGEVSRPVAIPFKTGDISLASALAASGSLSQTSANPRSVYVIRGVEREGAGMATTVYQLNTNSAVALSIADRFLLSPGDVLYVGPAQITRWNRVISQLLPSATLVKTANDAQN